MNLQLAEKKFLITGSSRGIGKSIAVKLLEEGASVILIARNFERLRKTAKSLADMFGAKRVLFFSVDCTNEDAMIDLRRTIETNWTGLDGIIANVGDGRSKPDAIPEREQWNEVWNTNFETALNTARVFLPMVNESAGSILFISSVAGLEAFGAPVDYSTAKTAVIALAKNMARKVAPRVRVNVIAPGNVYFPGGSWDEKLQRNRSDIEDMIKRIVPMQRLGTPEEIACAAVFLCSPLAGFITGALLKVDGGQTVSLF